MSKILTDLELLDIVKKTIQKDTEIDEQDKYLDFLHDLGELITNHFGGTVGTADYEAADDKYYIAFQVNEDVPPDGGIFKDYDKDVTWKDGKEV